MAAQDRSRDGEDVSIEDTEEITLPNDGGSSYVEGIIGGDILDGETQLVLHNWGDMAITVATDTDELTISSTATLDVEHARELRDELDDMIAMRTRGVDDE